jgi:thiosulfate reductase cytochrome b subunit
VADRLRALGVADPRIEGVLEPHALAHGIAGRDRALRDCAACHSEGSRLTGSYPIAAYLPGGVPPRPPDDGRLDLAGTVAPAAGGGIELRRDGDDVVGAHVLGLSRHARTNALGFATFLAVLAGVSLHAVARLALRRRRRAAVRPREVATEYVFGRYERLWHWTMAGSGLVLMLTGLAVHGGAARWPIAMTTAVTLHNWAAVVLIVNGFLSTFHHLTTRAIRHFIPRPHGLLERALDHIQYQSRGIFFGDPHPHHPGHKLNPLQQVTYLALRAVLLPFQVGTGALIWAVGHWPSVAAAAGGLHLVAPLHNLGSWLFVSFFVLHVYLVTTGTRVGDHLRSMITGYQSVPAAAEPEGT